MANLIQTKSRIMDRAIDVFGSTQAAMAFVDQPAMGLDRQRPADLMQTEDGAALVEAFLERLDTGTYT